MIDYKKYGVTKADITGDLKGRNRLASIRKDIARDHEMSVEDVVRVFNLTRQQARRVLTRSIDNKKKDNWGRTIDRFVLNCY